MVARLVQLITVLGMVIILSGCGLFITPEPEIRFVTRTVKVDVPIPYVPNAPPELRVGYYPDIPKFVSPHDPSSVMALDSANSALLKDLIHGLRARVDAWETWHSAIHSPKSMNE